MYYSDEIKLSVRCQFCLGYSHISTNIMRILVIAGCMGNL